MFLGIIERLMVYSFVVRDLGFGSFFLVTYKVDFWNFDSKFHCRGSLPRGDLPLQMK